MTGLDALSCTCTDEFEGESKKCQLPENTVFKDLGWDLFICQYFKIIYSQF